MNLDLVFGPVVAIETVFNDNVQINRTFDKQTKEYGWAITTDDDTEHFETLDDAIRGVSALLREVIAGYYDKRNKEMPA